MAEETRFRVARQADPEHYDEIVTEAEARIRRRLTLYEKLSGA